MYIFNQFALSIINTVVAVFCGNHNSAVLVVAVENEYFAEGGKNCLVVLLVVADNALNGVNNLCSGSFNIGGNEGYERGL